MVLVKILGLIDISAAIAFLMLTFGIEIITPFILFNAVLLSLKSLFLFHGDILSAIDLFSGIFLFLSLLFSLPVILLWTSAFLLLAKGVVSFL